jgi:hypothetical protein
MNPLICQREGSNADRLGPYATPRGPYTAPSRVKYDPSELTTSLVVVVCEVALLLHRNKHHERSSEQRNSDLLNSQRTRRTAQGKTSNYLRMGKRQANSF